MGKPTVGLAIITKELDMALKTKLCMWAAHFDEIYVQVNGSKGVELDNEVLHISKYKWNDNFADARNALQQEIKTDYWMWLDTDDDATGLENIRDMAEDMAGAMVDVMYFNYHYEINNIGETVVLQWRERLIRTSLAGKWMGAIHETFVPEDQCEYRRVKGVQVYHHKTELEQKTSRERNHKILLREYKKKPRDPRDTYYLALSYYGMQNWDKAIELFKEHITTSGWDEEQYRGWINIANSHIFKGEPTNAILAALSASQILPHYPDAYYVLQEAYYGLEQYGKSLEWYATASSKPIPESNQVIDPTVYKYRGKLQAATSLFCLGLPSKAFKLAKEVEAVQPNDPALLQLMPEFRRAYNEAEAIDKTRWLASFASANNGDGLKILEGLPPALKMDVRLREVRSEITPPKVWPKKSLAWFIGPGLETWGPDTLDKGMGGSEEAVLYLSRALAKQGWQVTVYNERIEEYLDTWTNQSYYTKGGTEGSVGQVTYLPWAAFNPADTFDVLVAWRNPSFHRQMKTKARVRGLDMHDTIWGHQTITQQDLAYVDKVFVKSQYQRTMSDIDLGDKAVVIPNGICRSHFEEAAHV